MLSGDNGLLKRAGDARDYTIVGQEKEQVELAYVSAAVKKLGTDVDESDMQTELNSSVGNNKTKVSTNTDDTLNVLFYDTEHNYNVNAGTVARVADGLPVIAWTYDHSTQTVTNGTLTLNIGDYVNDTGTQTVSGFDGKWRVLGVEDGQLLLTSASVRVPLTEGAISSYNGVSINAYAVGEHKNKILNLEGRDGWINSADALNAIGATFNNNKLEKGRSIKIEDINTITGYNPKNVGVNDSDQSGTGTTYSGYLESVTYRKATSNKIEYSTDGGESYTESTYTAFRKLEDGLYLKSDDDPYNLVSNYYMYYAQTLNKVNYSAKVGLNSDSIAYDCLFNLGNSNPIQSYWIASPMISAGKGVGVWAIPQVSSSGTVDPQHNLWQSDYGKSLDDSGVRAVVSLKSDITPTKISTDTTTGISTYEI